MIAPWLCLGPLALAAPPELAVEDFRFDGPLGSQGARIERVGRNHFKVTLAAAPHQPGWPNKLQFEILRHALGNTLQVDVAFAGGKGMPFNEYHHSFSYDGVTWQPVHWQRGYRESPQADTLVFPAFTADRVFVGHQVPMSYEDSVALIAQWRRSRLVSVTDLGRSLGGRLLQRVTITDPDSPLPPARRWVHYFSQQHPGEHNAQWRMVGIVDWLLSDEAADLRRRSICHFILFMSPDAPSHGWYRVNAQGVDMNRSYRAAGSSPEQAHEAYLCQRDLEALMASEAPVTTLWAMHTWGGIVEPLLTPGPEIGTAVGPWTELRDLMDRFDPADLVKTLAVRGDNTPGATTWTAGPHEQFGLTAILCEGAAVLDTKERNLASGQVIIKALDQYYRTPRPER